VTVAARARGPLDVIVFFTKKHSELERRFDRLARALDPAGGLWVGWPKGSSSLDTDLSETTVMKFGLGRLDGALVDNKVCAIDDDWSGLRFVVRKDRRADWPPLS
jgi:hypothetical protein